MNRLPMSPSAAALLRALCRRAGVTRDRILLIDVRSTDWRSLTFAGERHELQLRVSGPGSKEIVERLCSGLDEAEFDIAGAIVADIGIKHAEYEGDGSATLTIEALTVVAD
jgi:hypothetical protein